MNGRLEGDVRGTVKEKEGEVGVCSPGATGRSPQDAVTLKGC